MPPKKAKAGQRWSLYPEHHDEISSSLAEESLDYTFKPTDDDRTPVRTYDSTIMGRFTCTDPACNSSTWTSKRVAVTVRLYRDDRYNARVYHQQCKRCQTRCRPVLDDSYVERVSYRIKKWAGVDVEAPPFSEKGRSRKPHQRELCEGCKAGHCPEM